MPATAIHRQITAQKGWLNTARPLVADDLRGRIILLDFWTFCCINCMQIMPDLAYLEHMFDDKLTVIGVHSAKFANERDTENIRQAILRHDLVHPVVNDFNFAIWQGFAVHAWPTLVLINPDGKIESTYSGEGHRDELERDIARLVKQYGDNVTAAPLPLALEKDKAPASVLRFPTKLIYAEDYPGRSALLLADSGNQRVLALSLDGRVIEQIGSGKAGREDGDFEVARFATPQGLAWQEPVLYVADTGNHLLRAVHMGSRQVTSIAGTGKQGYQREFQKRPAMSVPLASPWDVALAGNNQLILAMAGTHQLWSYDIAAKTLSVLAGNGREAIDDGRYPYNSLSQPSGISVVGDTVYFVDAETSSLRMFKDGAITTLIGHGLFDFGFKDGVRDGALMQHSLGLAADKDAVYIADSYNHSIRRYDIAQKRLTTLAGSGKRGFKDGALADALFNEPNDLLLLDGKLYVVDTNNHAIRVIDLAAGKVSTLQVRQEQSLVDDFAQALPNLQSIAEQPVADGVPVSVMLGLAEGWKINRDAPSNLTLFQIEGKKHTAVARFAPEQMLDKRVLLPALAKGQYRLQGTLYYCQSAEGSQCLLKSFDMTLMVGGGASEFTLPVQP